MTNGHMTCITLHRVRQRVNPDGRAPAHPHHNSPASHGPPARKTSGLPPRQTRWECRCHQRRDVESFRRTADAVVDLAPVVEKGEVVVLLPDGDASGDVLYDGNVVVVE